MNNQGYQNGGGLKVILFLTLLVIGIYLVTQIPMSQARADKLRVETAYEDQSNDYKLEIQEAQTITEVNYLQRQEELAAIEHEEALQKIASQQARKEAWQNFQTTVIDTLSVTISVFIQVSMIASGVGIFSLLAIRLYKKIQFAKESAIIEDKTQSINEAMRKNRIITNKLRDELVERNKQIKEFEQNTQYLDSTICQLQNLLSEKSKTQKRLEQALATQDDELESLKTQLIALLHQSYSSQLSNQFSEYWGLPNTKDNGNGTTRQTVEDEDENNNSNINLDN